MEGSTIIVMGSSQIGDSLYWIQGEVSDASKLRKDAEEDKSETHNVPIENPLMINHWGEECNMKLPKTMTIELDRKLILALDLNKIQKDTGVTEDLFVYENYGMNDNRTSKADEDPWMG